MMSAVQICPFVSVRPMIYCYSTPGVTYHEGWVKIGYTEKQKVSDRIAQQTHTAGIRTRIEWREPAQYKDEKGDWFTDHDFHNYLMVEREVEREPNTEWFKVAARTARDYFNDFADRKTFYDSSHCSEYQLREEQQAAVDMTKDYFENGGKEFLWNAKPRFGKTLTAYDLIRCMGLKKVLVVTNRPSIANSWAEDFNKFIGWRGEMCFVSELDSVKGLKGVKSHSEYVSSLSKEKTPDGNPKGFIEFESLQNLKGSVYFGGSYDKLDWLAATRRDKSGKEIKGLSFDLLIIDEAHEGVDTIRTDRAFDNIERKYTLYLSGTPFRALASGEFNRDQIYNWTYADEQEKKDNWNKEEHNPYERLPRLSMFTYQLSNMIYDRIQRGADLSEDDDTAFTFDLNEFFATTESGKLVYEDSIKQFLHALVTQEKYPFSTPKLRKELSHTLWLLNRVASAKALSRLLKQDPVFSEYEIVLAAGDGKLDEEAAKESAYRRVKKAIREHDKTITLSVGQLTVGVTIPEWSGVLMLCNLQSPASYMQAAFRAQNPCMFTRFNDEGKPETVRKENAYVFDFDPARTLIIFDEFANNLSSDTAGGGGTTEDRQVNIKRLLNFFPVLGEDDEGKMIELDAAQVLSIPRRLKSVEVVRRGFMCNFLFQNVSNIFGAPECVKNIIEKLVPAHEESISRKQQEAVDKIDEISVDKNGNVEISNEIVIGTAKNVFGSKIYEILASEINPEMNKVLGNDDVVEKAVDKLADKIKEVFVAKVVSPVADNYDISEKAKKKVEKQISQEIDLKLDDIKSDFIRQKKVAEAELERSRREAETSQEVAFAEKIFSDVMTKAQGAFNNEIKAAIGELIQKKPKEVVEKMEVQKAEAEKKSVEDSVRDHLRGFSRTIPSFIMAYGDENLTLANFDSYTEDDVFQEVTGISEDDFRFLRDGGDYTDPETGKTEHFKGHLFDETVFNDSIQEFLKKRKELANYFEESHNEDIFDYIPPQKTNQIYTPRWVVQKMVDELEVNNPGCFDDPKHTFADLYMKSGLYVTEIVKRLFNSKGLRSAFPNDRDRIRHILRNQVYGMAPTRIIYLIATNYILGFDRELKIETKNFVQADSAEAAKNGTLESLINDKFAR